VLIADAGMPSAMVDAANEVNSGRRVLVLDPLFFGENSPGTNVNLTQAAQLLNSVGERAAGLEAAQITGMVRWLGQDLDYGSPTPGSSALNSQTATPPVRIITTGLRSETIAMIAVALEPELFSQFEARKSISSFAYAFDHPLGYNDAPEVMCLDLYRDFDFNTLSAIASPVKINLSAKQGQRLFWDD
jgi:hypothetical protein